MLLIHFASQGKCGITNHQSSHYCPQELAKATDEKGLQSPFRLLISDSLHCHWRKVSAWLQNRDFVSPLPVAPIEIKASSTGVLYESKESNIHVPATSDANLFHRSTLTLEFKAPEGFSIQVCTPATTGRQWRRPNSTLAQQSCPHLTQACRAEQKSGHTRN